MLENIRYCSDDKYLYFIGYEDNKYQYEKTIFVKIKRNGIMHNIFKDIINDMIDKAIFDFNVLNIYNNRKISYNGTISLNPYEGNEEKIIKHLENKTLSKKQIIDKYGGNNALLNKMLVNNGVI